MRRRRYRDDPSYRGGRAYRGRGGGGNSCARDACLVESGCCLAEALDGNCLIAAAMLLPQMLATRSDAGRHESRLVSMIRFYQREISARRDPVCRFSPSCSNYAVEAITTYGAVRGTYLAARRLVRCRPGGNRGADPVPAFAGLT